MNKVRTQPYMTFVGVPGSGKSATIHHIALILEKEGYEAVPIIDISEIYRYCDPHNPQVFVIDDVVGVFGLQTQKLETLVDYEKIISDPSRHTKVLMSCREAVLNECYESFFKNEENVIKMCSPENSLNDEDKKAIFQRHGLDKDLLSPTLLREASAMFPLLCKLISKEASFRNNIERFLTCPTACILKEFDKMRERNRLHYATLVLCLLNNNKLSKEILNDTENKAFYEMKSKALESCEVESYTDPFKFVKALAAMEGTYTKLYGTEYTFIHDSMFEIIAHHFGSQFLDLILQFMSSSYIANYVKLQKYEMLKLESELKQASEKVAIKSEVKNEKNIACESSQKGEKEALSAENCDRMESFDLCIRIGEDQYSLLAERLYKDIENMELYDVFMNNALKHPKVCQAFIEVLKTKSYSELKSLFLSEQKDVSKVVSKGERVTEESEERDKRSRERHRQEVLVNGIGITYSVRVISWVVYYGHSQIMQYILEQTDLHKETQSEFFWNFFHLDFTQTTKQDKKNIAANYQIENPWSFRDPDINGSISEHKRLLLLSCYNGDLETVKIFTRYFKRETIYMTYPNLDIKYVLGNKTLSAACEEGHPSVVKELLEARADVNKKDMYDTPLTAACRGGHLGVVKELLAAGVDANQNDKYDTPLTIACEGGHLSVVKELLGARATVNPYGVYKLPLIVACDGGFINIVKELLEAGADVNAQSFYDTPLRAAAEGGYISIVKKLLGAGANVNQQDYDGLSACKGGHLNIVRELVEAGVDVNLLADDCTPLTAACKGGHLNIVRELVEAGVDVNLLDEDCTPLTAACKGGHLNIVRELLVAGADVNLEGKSDTPLTTECKGGHLNIVRELLEAKADVNLQVVYHTPLTAACKGGHTDLVKELLEAGADVNPRGKIDSPLTVAVKVENMIIFKKLLSVGADVNPQDKFYTPLIAACEGKHESFVKELLDAGADVNLQSIKETPLITACYGGHLKIVMELLKAGANVNLQIKSYTALIAAFWGEHEDVVKELLKAGANVNFQGKYYKPMIMYSGRLICSSPKSYSTLTLACKYGYLREVKTLLKAGAEVNPRDEYFTPLIAAIWKGDMSIMKELLSAGADVNLQGECETPMIEACRTGHMNIVKELLKKGTDVNLQGKYDTPLISACTCGYTSIVIELLKAGADVNLGKHNTPLIAACNRGYISIVIELLKAGADVNLQRQYETPLANAIKCKHSNIVTELIKAGADVNLQGLCDTPLTKAIKYECSSIVTELIKAGANVNIQEKYKYNTPLILACSSGQITIVIELIKAGADINAQGGHFTPLTAACKNGYMDIAKILLDAGSDVNKQDKEGNTPLYTAFSISKAFKPVILRMFDIYCADSTINNKEDISTVYIALIKNENGSVKQLLSTENESQSNKLKLHLFDCLVNIRHSDVMTDSKDDVVATRKRLWRMERGGDLYEAIIKSDCSGLKHLLCVGLDVNQWIQLYNDYNDEYDKKPLLFTLIDESYRDNSLVVKVQILLEAEVDVNVSVRYRKYDSVSDREGVSVLERTRRLLSACSKKQWLRDEVFKYTRVIKEVKKHVRRYSV
ncbi:serine/threonine-protein phosphatase 6 regulatory ankyrin repeat subunit B-like [Saccostrea cucullata]|uniref:serine/threonine-protein phosphatase 6 regulatory ankyrin repeat subunit B-like n=1 Tax=Saccostrea cuccullata TaxID=36930 RepID=UPI002ED102EA